MRALCVIIIIGSVAYSILSVTTTNAFPLYESTKTLSSLLRTSPLVAKEEDDVHIISNSIWMLQMFRSSDNLGTSTLDDMPRMSNKGVYQIKTEQQYKYVEKKCCDRKKSLCAVHSS